MEQAEQTEKRLALDEQETLWTIEATDRNTVKVFSNDQVFQRRLAKLGIVPYRTDGYGMFYSVSLDNFSFGIRKKRAMTDEQRRVARNRFMAVQAGNDDDDENEDDADED
jgi:hypothetical protein